MSDICTRVTRTLEAFPFKETGYISLFLERKREIFSDQTFLISILKSSATLSLLLKIYASAMYIAGIYFILFLHFLHFCWLVIYTLLLLSLEAHFAPLGSINLVRW